MNLRQWQRYIFEWGAAKGWHESPMCDDPAIWGAPPIGVDRAEVGLALALIHAEISEALECVRDDDYLGRKGPEGKPEGMEIELADAVIRILHISERLGFDMEHAVKWKMEYNETRPHRHGKKC